MTRTFDIGKALAFGWDATMARLWFFIGLTLVVFLAVWVPMGIGFVLTERAPAVHWILLYTIGYVLSIILGMGFYKICFRIVDGEIPQFGDLFSCALLFWKC